MKDQKNSAPPRSGLPDRSTYALTALLGVVAILQAAGGLFIPGLYRDNTWVVSVFQGTDVVTLIVAVPSLIGSLVFALRGSVGARLVLAGTSYYLFYNNLYYLFSAFNRFFLVYVALFILSLALLVSLFLRMDAGSLRVPGNVTARRACSVAMFVCAALLMAMWVGQSVLFILNGQVPQLITDSGGVTHMVAALDLTLEVPPLVLGGILLWRARPWGAALSSVILVECVLVTINLLITPFFQEAAGIQDAWMMVPLWACMVPAFLVPAVYILKNITREP